MNKAIIILFLILLLPLTLLGFDSNTKFQEANNLYNTGNYNKASEIYEDLLNNGYREAIVYYNLGNSYFRLNKIPHAILNYERARILDPLDDGIIFNLKLANLKIVDKFEPIPKLFFIDWYENFIDYTNSNTWAFIFLLFFWLTFILLSGFALFSASETRKKLFRFTVLALIFSIGSLFFAFKTFNSENERLNAIIFNTSVYVKSAPDLGATDLFILHEGTKVRILDRVSNWIEIKIENGNVGWIPKESLQII
jgi:tetratricopeptide (TPR) repeat protein